MLISKKPQHIGRHERMGLRARNFARVSLGSWLSAVMFLVGTIAAQAADSCLDNVPVPTLKVGLHRVVQLVNCSNQWVLGTANAAHNATSKPTPVFPREGTWVIAPVPPPGSSSHANVLTIDIPLAWENTGIGGSAGPNFWVRTGCRFDTVNGIAQCETGGCSGFYDCSKNLKGPPYGTTLAEWNFAQPVVIPSRGKGNGKGQGTTYFIDNMDISAVNGLNLNLDIQPLRGSTSNPTNSNDLQ